MNDAEFETEKARVDKVFREWGARLPFEGWRLTPYYWRDQEEFLEPSDNPGHHYRTAAKTEVHWEYLSARLDFNLQMMAEKDDELAEDVVHELMHCLVAEIAGPPPAPNVERVVTVLSKAFLWVYEDGRKDGEAMLAAALGVPA